MEPGFAGRGRSSGKGKTSLGLTVNMDFVVKCDLQIQKYGVPQEWSLGALEGQVSK